MTCEICEKILSIDDSSAEDCKEVELGKLGEILESECEFHRKLMGLETRGEALLLDGISPTEAQNEQPVFVKWDAGRYEIRYRFHRGGSEWNALFAGPFVKFRDSVGRGRGLPLDQLRIAKNLLRDWISKCDAHHGESCQSSSSGSRVHTRWPFYLINTRNNCLVEANGQEYCVLSYVWGNAISLSTMTSNLAELKRPGALANHRAVSALAETTRNTIELVRTFDTPYLWVNALCVVQDDRSMRENEIEKMADIFANASIAIIAGAGADANYGLRGLRDVAKPRELEHRPLFLMPDGGKFVEPLFDAYGHLRKVGPKYSSRAWTFQEQILPRRKIIFEGQSVRWECERVDWYEDIDHNMDLNKETNIFREIKQFRAALKNEEPASSLSTEIIEIISAYNRRELTYSQDALLACAGVLSMRTALGDSFISGMPVRSLDTAMLWQPVATADRRQVRTGSFEPAAREEHCLPGWSWVGWRCQLDISSWDISCHVDVQKEFESGFMKGSYTTRFLPTVN